MQKSFNPLLDPSLDGKIVTDKLNGRFMTISGVTPIALAGNRNNTQGFFVAKPGIDVRNATDAQLIFNSNQNIFAKILKTGFVTIAPFTAAANSVTVGSITTDYVSGIPGFTPIVYGFTNSLPAGGLFLWQGVSPESLLTSPLSSPMGFTVYIRFDTFISEPIQGTSRAQFNVTVRNATASPLTGITYTLKYFFLQETIA